jgi:phospholipid transport system substrate-binding protein
MYHAKRTLLTTVLILSSFSGILLVPKLCMAQTSPSSQTTQVQQAPEGKFIQDLGNKAISFAADKSLSPAELDAKYNDLLNSAFDMPSISRFVLGRAWFSATPEQQQEYLTLFKKLVLKTYGSRLHFYNGEAFHVTTVHSQSTQDSTVGSVITHPDNSAPTPIDWMVRHESNGQYAIIDVVVSGVSQSVTQRDEFASILGNNNGSMDALINVLRQKVQQDQPQP